jgi:hypothetical protein
VDIFFRGIPDSLVKVWYHGNLHNRAAHADYATGELKLAVDFPRHKSLRQGFHHCSCSFREARQFAQASGERLQGCETGHQGPQQVDDVAARRSGKLQKQNMFPDRLMVMLVSS